MASLPGGSCRVYGCKNISSRKNNGYCEAHKNEGWSKFQRSKEGEVRPYQSSVWKKKRQLVINRDMGLCCECSRNGIFKTGNEVDHIIPVSQGGSDELSNLQLLCNSCHKKKTASE